MPVTISDMAEQAGVTERCMRDRIKEQSEYFWIKNGLVGEIVKQNSEDTQSTEKDDSLSFPTEVKTTYK